MSHQNIHDSATFSSNTENNHDISSKSTTQQNLIQPLTSWIGNTLPQDKPPNTLRITFQNLNCIRTTYTAQNMTTIILEQITIESDILCMTEHCINVHHRDIHHQIQSSIRNAIKKEKVNLQITSSNTQTESPYLPGGTAIAVIGNSVGRLEQTSRGRDAMGRWTYITMKRKHQSPITIVSVYQVNTDLPMTSESQPGTNKESPSIKLVNLTCTQCKHSCTISPTKSKNSNQRTTILFLAEISTKQQRNRGPDYSNS